MCCACHRRVPSQAMDGSQFITQKVAGSVASVVSPVKPLKYAVDATGGAVSNVLGSTSRLLGKSVKKPHRVIFLYGRSINSHGTSQAYQEAIRLVVGHALANVMLHPEDMQSGHDEPADLSAMPVLESLVGKLKRSGAPDSDLEAIVKVLGRNGKEDLPSHIEPKVRWFVYYPVTVTYTELNPITPTSDTRPDSHVMQRVS